MKQILAFIFPLVMGLASETVQRRVVVMDADLKVPVRDVQIYTPEGVDLLTAWDGTFMLPDSFSRLNFRHPHFEQRYLLPSELHGDTVWLLPVSNALGEVIIWGRRRFDERMKNILKPSPQQIERDKLPQAIPAGPDVLAIAGWLFEKTVGKAIEKRSRRKKHQKAMREKEEEYQRKWDLLKDTDAVQNLRKTFP
ncbi:MAG: hypothetical protein J5658_01975 [Prevotella sp.]|nr:hypothetical protein [Prevotella sp.]